MENNDQNRYVQIGARIREARELEGLTQLELAEKLRYKSPTAISLIEAGERRIQISDLEMVARVLHRDVSYFINENVGTNSQPSVQIALRADRQLDQEDVNRIESFIDALKISKGNSGRRPSDSK